jgi:diadenosine tetraphosphate (Ap4A) HIT family hydrolase
VDPTSFTDGDLARLAMSSRLRDLSETLRTAVAAEDGDSGSEPGLATRLWSLLTTEVPLMQEAIVAHVRGSGGSWADVAAVTALTEDEARERWGTVEPARTADPVATAAALDEWYTRHAGMEPLAQFADPFSRLLSAHAPAGPMCHICEKYKGAAMPAHAGRVTPPGGHLIDDGMWRVGHGPTPFWPAGTLLIESHRHFLDFAELDDEEAAAIGPLIRRLVGPLREATGAPRIHVFSCMEGAPHFHVWLVPRTGTVASGRTFIGNPGYCSVPEAEAVVARIRAALARAEAAR